VPTALAVVHFRIDHGGASSAFTRRRNQCVHDAIRQLLAPWGSFRSEVAGDLMMASELPYVVLSVIGETGATWRETAERVAARPLGELSQVDGWSIGVWPDLAVLAAPLDNEPDFCLARKNHGVALSVMLDAALLRVAERQVLEALARRVTNGADVADETVVALQRVSVRLHSRLWWPRVSHLPSIQRLADELDESLGLSELAHSTQLELGSLAEHARALAEAEAGRVRREQLEAAEQARCRRAVRDRQQVESDRQITRLLFVLTAGSVGLTFVALVVAVVTSSREIPAILASVTASLLALLITTVFYRRLRRKL